ncbi:hypothetical protein WICMUC_001602 [Wickerhamomyces mucosus]|uniref:Mediator complex subunit 8 n=1 Tax=Wickerhamomyces mucosus TaxID=1378264 RepID=A0A9P8PTW7_9ASCO|nr:hypothetical protein WICMUC_001602 [Wickerhamomyces mucosus]
MQASQDNKNNAIDFSSIPVEALESLRLRLTQLASLSSTLTSYSEILDQTVTYPLPQFPTTEQEGLLTTLLRKKALPEVIDWIKESKENSTDILLKDDEDSTRWAAELVLNKRNEYNFNDESDGDMMVTDLKPEPKLNVDQVLKYMYQGVLPEKK